MAKIADVVIKVDSKDIDKANQKIKKTEKSTNELTASAKGLKAFTKAGIIGGVIIAIGVTVGKFAEMGKQAAAAIDKIAKSAKKLGLTAEEFQLLANVADASGVAIAEFEMGFQRFSRRVGDVTRGIGPLKKVFEELNISVTDNEGNLKSNTELYKEFNDALAATTNHTVAMSRATAGYDVAGAKFLAIAKTSTEEQTRLNNELLKYGGIVANDVARSMEGYTTQLGLIEKGNDALGNQIDSVFAPLSVVWAELENDIKAATANLLVFFNVMDNNTALQAMKVVTLQDEMGELVGQYEKQFISMERILGLDLVKAKQAEIDKETELLNKLKEREKKAAELRLQGTITTPGGNTTPSGPDAAVAKAAADEVLAIEKLKNTNIENEIKASQARRLAIAEEGRRMRATLLTTEVTDNRNAFSKIADNYNNTTQVMTDMGVQWTQRAGDALTEMVMTGQADFHRLASSVVADIVAMIIKQQLFNAIAGAIGGGGVTSVTTDFSIPMTSQTFAKGAVISSNTDVPGGVAGERTPEAILPLKRDKHGILGVTTSSGGGAASGAVTNITVINNTKSEVSTSDSVVNGEKMITVMVEEAIGSLVQSGRFDKFQASYGNRRKGVR